MPETCVCVEEEGIQGLDTNLNLSSRRAREGSNLLVALDCNVSKYTVSTTFKLSTIQRPVSQSAADITITSIS